MGTPEQPSRQQAQPIPRHTVAKKDSYPELPLERSFGDEIFVRT